MHELKGVHYATETPLLHHPSACSKTRFAAKCVLNVLFLVTDFKPSRGVETLSEAGFHASVCDHVNRVSHKPTLTRLSNQASLKLCFIYLMHT